MFVLVAIICLALCYFFFFDNAASTSATVLSDGEAVMTLDLSLDSEYKIVSEYGENLLRVADGKVSVISADCPTQVCVQHAPADSGAPIVCLPNRMVIIFSNAQEYDAMIG